MQKKVNDTQICGLLKVSLFSIKIINSETTQKLVKAVTDYQESKKIHEHERLSGQHNTLFLTHKWILTLPLILLKEKVIMNYKITYKNTSCEKKYYIILT
jgi:hypothetical protein